MVPFIPSDQLHSFLKGEHGASACSTPIPSDHCQVRYVVHRSLESMKLPLTQTYF